MSTSDNKKIHQHIWWMVECIFEIVVFFVFAKLLMHICGAFNWEFTWRASIASYAIIRAIAVVSACMRGVLEL